MKEQLINNLEIIVNELNKGKDITIKRTKEGIKIQSIKVKTIT